MKQLLANGVLELSDLATYRALSHTELGRRACETQVPRGSIEELQSGQRREQPTSARAVQRVHGQLRRFMRLAL